MPNRRPPESAAFGGHRRSWRRASAGPAAGRGASTATAPVGSGPPTTIHRLSRGHAGSAVLPERSRFELTPAPILRAAEAELPELAPQRATKRELRGSGPFKASRGTFALGTHSSGGRGSRKR